MEHARGILFVDLDGTLVGPDGVADRVWPALARLREAGVRIALCTGRPGRGIAADIARRLDPEGLHVVESGAVVMRGTGEVFSAHTIEPEHARALAELAARLDVTLEAYTADGRYLVRERSELVRRHEALLGLAAEVVPWPPSDPVVRLLWVVPEPEWPALEREAASVMRHVAAHSGRSPKMPGISFISMTAPSVSKATGVRSVLEAFTLDRARAAMAGDDLNDLVAFAEVDHVFVPSDGAPEARARAHVVIPSPSLGGVADAAKGLIERWASNT